MTHFWSARPVMPPSDHNGDAIMDDEVSLAAASELCWECRQPVCPVAKTCACDPLPARAPEHKVPADISLWSASNIPRDAF
jgi:hypothetical protein